VRVSALSAPVSLTQRVVILVAAQTLTITGTNSASTVFSIGVGAADTPTPSRVTGDIQARYLDPKQNQRLYPIQLTSLHSVAADEPFGGTDDGLIGVHYEAVSTGNIFHGCIRLPANAITAVNALPLGTLVTITP
jgi:lipoprotein-anchoring transpeptidase ErfK/SrfK